MISSKNKILDNLCYTELVYSRINKKLKSNFTKSEIEERLLTILEKTDAKYYQKIGKNFYVSNNENNIKITVNSNTYRIITVDMIKNKS
ncbi:hypothetical protein BSF41_43480 [Flavobacterium sp. ACN2]|jgi:hypothetical protein|uniref:DUF3781 domain-containing protein n=1 Tax=Flavobacterium sp. ACN2 TaxID=1975676 RepID=UPI001C0EE502|nr:DUF3781 domain-containing protein [Flavobacterium sp. ACN2]PBI84249.1 hypothetical protein BSF41_43480 [Flavobacterium sp. ACN2]